MRNYFKNKKKLIKTLSRLRTLFVICIILSAVYIAKWFIDSKQNEILEEKVSEAITIENVAKENITIPEYKIDFKKLKEINNEVVAWLKVNGTEIEYPVVQTKDNKYYLKRNLEKKYNIAGWVFLDYKNKLDNTDKNIVIYGHNVKDNSMFGSLKNVLTEEWFNNEQNHIIEFITESENQKYQVFSVYKIEKEDYYINTEFNSSEFSSFIKEIEQRSIKKFDIKVTEEDTILTLSTCDTNDDYRVVLHAKKISM